MSKKMRVLYFMLMSLPVVITMVSLSVLPDQIPAHYGFDGQVTRWGSKYELLILPVFVLLFGLFMIWVAKLAGNKEKYDKNNEKSVMLVGILVFILFNAENIYLLYVSFHKVKNLTKVNISIEQIVMGILGISLIIIGNIMPKLKRNAVIGLCTSWSMENEITWERSQKFGGIMLMLVGTLMVFVCCLCKGELVGIISLILIVLMVPVSLVATYMIAKKYGNEI